MKKELEAVVRGVESTGSSEKTDPCPLAQYEEQLSGLKVELAGISRNLLSLDDIDGSLMEQEERLSLSFFDICLKVKHLLSRNVDHPAPTVSKNGVKLPKLAVLIFDMATSLAGALSGSSTLSQCKSGVTSRRHKSSPISNKLCTIAPPSMQLKGCLAPAISMKKRSTAYASASIDLAFFIRLMSEP